MSPFWFGRSTRFVAQNNVRPGNRHRRPLGAHFVAMTVLETRPNLVGIPHVRFTVAVARPSGAQLDEDTRMLARQSFLETYCERFCRATQGPGLD
jgi:hypothetical protein